MNQKGLWKRVFASLFVFLTFCTLSSAYGSGFAIYTQGASALGQADAVIAHADDPSAVFFNPALINKLSGTQIESGTTLLFPSQDFESNATGDTFSTKNDVFYPSTLFVTHKFNDKISAGLGIFSPFGLGTDWGDDWEGRYIATNSEMQTFNINPVVSYQIVPNVAFAAGVDLLLLDTTLEKNINMSAFGLPDAGQKFDGNGDGVGFNFGVLYDITEDISFGVSYRSEIDVNIDGNATFDLSSDTPPVIGALFPNTDGNADISLPQQVHAGICYKGFNNLTLETGLRWEDWSSFKELKVTLDQPVGGSNESITEKNWQDAYAVNLGAKYRFNDTVALLAGYLYSGNPVPDNTFDPIVPDANVHLFTIGTSIKYKKINIDLSYGYQKFEGTNKDNTIDDNPSDGVLNTATSANGQYDTDFHMFGISLTYKF